MGGGSGPSAARSALADAAAGVAGSLVSMLAFYPVDVYKTNLQAGKCGSGNGGGGLSRRNRNGSSQKKKDDARNTILYLLQFLRSSFRGIQYKTAHTIAGSFAYFFFYSWITARHRAYVTGGSGGGGSSKGGKYSPSTPARLLLAAIAAMMNTTLTLPLDVISARQQTGHLENGSDDSEDDNALSDDENSTEESVPQSSADIMNQAWDEADNGDDSPSPPKEREALVRMQSGETAASGYVTAEEEDDEEKKGDDDEPQSPEDTKPSERRLRKCTQDPIRPVGMLSPRQKYDLKSIASLWSGVVPSLLLCTNPSIHFTVFDTLKSSILQRKSAAASLSAEGSNGDEPRLSMGEAFSIGLLAKFAATIATYPLIRAKVMLMCNGKGTSIQREESNNEERYNFRRGDTTLNFGGRLYDKNAGSGTKTVTSEGTEAGPNLWGVLCSIYKNEGVPGLYRGCNLQLIHTLLKSALLMMVRERITVTTRRMILKSQQ